MPALRFALVAALISVSVMPVTDGFAKGAAGGAGGASGGAGGASGGASGGGAGHVGAAPLALTVAYPPKHQSNLPAFHPREIDTTFSSCFKQEELYDRRGYPVIDVRSEYCYKQ